MAGGFPTRTLEPDEVLLVDRDSSEDLFVLLEDQYADHEGGLGMVDVVLGSLMRGPGHAVELGSERDPEPEY